MIFPPRALQTYDRIPEQDQIKAALKARSLIMFSGASGDVVPSGIKGDAAVLKEPDLGLVRAAIEVVSAASLVSTRSLQTRRG